MPHRGPRLHTAYATPSTDTALANLPAIQAGSGAGIYKMASSLGGAIGAAISLALFTAFRGSTEATVFLGDVLVNFGWTDNVALRRAAVIALAFNLLMVAIAIVSITLTVPKSRSVTATE